MSLSSRSIVVQRDPVRERRRKLLLVVIASAVILVALVSGAGGTLRLYMDAAAENSGLRELVSRQGKELEELRQWRAENSTRGEVDAAALEMVRRELASQQETIAELERGIRFYKSLMAPGELAEGLNVRSIDFTPGEHEAHYSFRILVQQNARKHALMTGTAQVVVLGTLDGQAVEYNLAEWSEQLPNTDIRLRFKYFQAIDGELALPSGFVPEMVKVTARSTKPRRSEVSAEFPWSVQEKISHVGQ